MVDELKRSVGLFVALAAAVAWAVLASRTPTSTYHFAPMVVAAAWVLVDGFRGAGVTQRRAVNLALVGLVLSVAVTIVLEAKGDLAGPVFWEGGDDAPVVLEHVLFAILGAGGGLLLAVRQASRPPTPA